jgi:hypothetical protein
VPVQSCRCASPDSGASLLEVSVQDRNDAGCKVPVHSCVCTVASERPPHRCASDVTSRLPAQSPAEVGLQGGSTRTPERDNAPRGMNRRLAECVFADSDFADSDFVEGTCLLGPSHATACLLM